LKNIFIKNNIIFPSRLF